MTAARSPSDKTLWLLSAMVSALICLLVCAVPTAAYYYFGLNRIQGAIETEAAFMSGDASRIISLSPMTWRYQEDRFLDILNGLNRRDAVEMRQILDEAGDVIAEQSATEFEPTNAQISTEYPIFDSGVPIGRVVIFRSIEQLNRAALAVLGISGALACLLFATTFRIPFRLLQREINRAAFLASHDVLTGLPNRALFKSSLTQACEDVKGRGHPAALLLLDLDKFKDVNDTFGHAAGDELLRQTVARVQAVVPKDAVFARLGGDEFGIVLPPRENSKEAVKLAATLIAEVEKDVVIENRELHVGASIGISLIDRWNVSDLETAMQQADMALYRAKSAGRGQYVVYSEEMNRRLLERKLLEHDLSKAIERQQLELMYQPQICSRSLRVVGVEALIRWNHPEKGTISPGVFIPLAEENGMILAIGDWVISQACHDAASWSEIRVAINISPIQLKHTGLFQTVKDALDVSGLRKERLELEITENLFLEDTDHVINTLSQFQKLGIKIAMDDFGTGYSSLAYVSQFSFDKIKIDRSFVDRLGQDETSNSIVQMAISLGKTLGIRVNAEGVESELQIDVLSELGCDEFQGFAFSSPRSKEEIDRFLDANTLKAIQRQAIG